MTTVCKNCDGTGWVCERHEASSWGGENECPCGGAGAPCKWCNPCDRDNPPRMLNGSTVLWTIEDGTAH